VGNNEYAGDKQITPRSANTPKRTCGTYQGQKAQLKSPLGDRHPFALVRYRAPWASEESVVIEDQTGERLALTDTAYEGQAGYAALLSLPKSARHDRFARAFPSRPGFAKTSGKP
jgi:hypothetical protein